jgi:hypothetical protein
VAVISGNWKCGKTHMALNADPIVAFQSLDLGTEGVVEKVEDAPNRVRIAEYALGVQPGEVTEDIMAREADKVWQGFVRDYHQALNDPAVRTIVWDTETEVWQLLRLARFGVLTPKTGRDRGNVWGPVNAEMLGLIRAAFSSDKSLIMLEKVKDEYKNDKKTGMKVASGFGDVPFQAQIVATAYRDGDPVPSCFKVLVTDCRSNPDLNGVTIPNDWATLMEMVHG